jgi:hypothetical protein
MTFMQSSTGFRPRQHPTKRVSAFASVVASLMGLAMPALAQTASETGSQSGAQPAGQLPTFLLGAAEPESPEATCIAQGYAPRSQTAMQMKLTVLPDGTLQGLPELIAPAAPSADVRVDYLGIVTAAESCAPLGWAPAGDYMLSVAADGQMGVTPIAATAAVIPATPVAPVTPVAPAPAGDGTGQTGEAPAFPTFLAQPETAPAADPPAGVLPTFLAPTALLPSSPETEELMTLDRQVIRDVQARLLVSGFDPNGVDGVMGRGARAALAAWQASVGVDATGYLSDQQLQALQSQSQAQLDVWLQDAGNVAQYTPPKKAVKKTRQKRRVRACKRNALGMLYDCRYVFR